MKSWLRFTDKEKYAMKKFFILPIIFLSCAFLAACGAKKEPEGAWIGIGPGSDLNAVTERTEY